MASELKWPRRLVIVRHGQSEMNAAKDLFDEGIADTLKKLADKRDVDIELTSAGIWQATQTGIYLAGTPKFDACFSSPFERAMQTAHYIMRELRYKITPDDMPFKDNRLREKEFGILHGLSTDDIQDQFPHEYKSRSLLGKYWYRLPGGENYPDVEQRAHEFQDKLVRDYGGKNVLVVTHQVTYLMLRALFEHLDEKGVLALGDVPNCGMQEYIIDTSKTPEGRMRLVRYNEVAYDMANLPVLND